MLQNRQLSYFIFPVTLTIGIWAGWQWGQTYDTDRPKVSNRASILSSSSQSTDNPIITPPKSFDALRRLALQNATHFDGRLNLMPIVSNYSTEELEAFLVDSVPFRQHPGFNPAMEPLSLRLAQIDPERAIGFATEQLTGPTQEHLFIAGLRVIAKKDLSAAREYAEKIDDIRFRRLAAEAIIRVVGLGSPRAALDSIELTHKKNDIFNGELSKSIIDDWVMKDLDGATAYLLDRDNSDHYLIRIQLFEAIAPKLIQRDLGATLDLWEHMAAINPRHAETWLYDDMVSAWSDIDFQAALNFSHNAFGGSGIFKREPLVKWIEAEPDKAINWLMQMENKRKQREWIEALSYHSFSGVPHGAVLTLIEQVRPDERYGFWESVARKMTGEHLPELFGWINQLPDYGGRNRAIWECIEHLPRMNAETIELMKESFANDPSQNFVRGYVERWTQNNPDAAFEWIQTQRSEQNYEELLGQYASIQATSDPYGALQVVASLSDTNLRQRYVREAIKELLNGEPEIALSAIRNSVEGDLRDWAYFEFIQRYSDDSPRLALEVLHEIPPEYIKQNQPYWDFKESTQNLEPNQLIDFVRKMPQEIRQVRPMLSRVAEHDPDWAIRLLQDQNLMQDSPMTLQQKQIAIARGWSEKSMEAAMQWATRLYPPNAENAVLNGLLKKYTYYSVEIERAKEHITSMPEGAAKHSAALEILSQIASRNAKDAFEWARPIGDENIQLEVVNEIAKFWLRQDSLEASEWIDALPDGAIRDAGALKLIDHIRSTSPSEAFPWALSISDARLRTRYVQSVVSGWMRVDPSAAYQAIRYSSDLNADEKNDLLSRFNTDN